MTIFAYNFLGVQDKKERKGENEKAGMCAAGAGGRGDGLRGGREQRERDGHPVL